jgi:Tol biopolymer transport system component
MNLETRAHLATDETLGLPLDVEGGLTALRRTRRRRATAKAVAASVALVAAVSAVLVARQQDRAPEPVGTFRNGPILSLSVNGIVQRVSGPWPTGLPPTVDVEGPFAVSPDGDRLYFAKDHEVRAMDLVTGEQTDLAPCPGSHCLAAVSPDGSHVAVLRGRGFDVTDVGSGALHRISTAPSTVFAPVWSPDGSQMAFLGPDLMVVDVATGTVRTVSRIADSLGEQPAWSPDGRTLAYVEHRPPRQGGQVRVQRLILMTVPTDGGRPQEVHSLGRCACIRSFPAVTWSPDGQRIAVTRARHVLVGGPAYSVRPDGSDWRRVAGGSYQDRLVWRPVTPAD